MAARPIRLEGVVHAAAGQLLHRLHGVRVARVDGVGRAEVLRDAQLVLDHVDGNDLPRSGEPRALDDVEPDTTGADHGHRRARLDLRGVDRGAVTGHDRATDEGCDVEADVVRDLDEAGRCGEHVLGEPADVGHLRDGFIAERDGRVVAASTDGRGGVAEVGAAGVAEGAVPAGLHEADDYAVAGLHGRHPNAHRFDDARDLVPEHGREPRGVGALDEVQVGVADTGGDDLHARLAGGGVVDAQVLDRHGGQRRAQDGALGSLGHTAIPPRVVLMFWLGDGTRGLEGARSVRTYSLYPAAAAPW